MYVLHINNTTTQCKYTYKIDTDSQICNRATHGNKYTKVQVCTLGLQYKVNMYMYLYLYVHKTFANPRKLLHQDSHLWRLTLASHYSTQPGQQYFVKCGYLAEYMYISLTTRN